MYTRILWPCRESSRAKTTQFQHFIESASVDSVDHAHNPHQENHTRAVARAVNVNASNMQVSEGAGNASTSEGIN